jgi:plastocyanin
MRRLLLVGVLGVLAVAGGAWAGTQVVELNNLKFSVSLLNVTSDDVLEFDNNDDDSHNVTIAGEALLLNSGLQAPGDTFKVRLTRPGVYSVTDGIHPRMKMTVVVR